MSLAFFANGCGPRGTTKTGGSTKAVANDPQALEQLKGTWRVTGIEAAGDPVPSDRVQKISLDYVFDGDRVTIRRPDRPDRTSTISLDTSVSPKKITIHQSPPAHALYAVEGNKLRLCLMVDENRNAGFPTELASKPSPKTDLLTLERR
jgi:uncharacterized protein (TIGR03067 family)